MSVVEILFWLGVAVVGVYVFVRIGSLAYFRSKVEYHHRLFASMQKHNGE